MEKIRCQLAHMARKNLVRGIVRPAVLAGMAALGAAQARADAPASTIGYQPMVSTGLAARHPFEAWLVFDRSPDPAVPGYAVPAGARVRLTFPKEFTPMASDPHLEGALLYGWPQGAIPVPFSVTQDKSDPRSVVVRIDQPIPVDPPERPGLKAIHVRTAELNPSGPGDFPIAIEFIDAGALSGTTSVVAHITAQPVPNVAAFNHLHQGRDEDFQRVRAGDEALLPIDFLVTLPEESRSSISITPVADGSLSILSDGKPIGSITTQGVPVTLIPRAFGPGFARLGIIEVRARSGTKPGAAQIVASLVGGTRTVITLIVQ